jgi:hypothetical protein
LYRQKGSKSPDDAFPSQSSLNMIVTGDVLAVVVVHEIMISHLSIDRNGCDDPKLAYQELQMATLHINNISLANAKLIAKRN